MDVRPLFPQLADDPTAGSAPEARAELLRHLEGEHGLGVALDAGVVLLELIHRREHEREEP